MTAETLHDALSLLPDDLVAETGRKRLAKPRIIPWKRYLAMAACFGLVLGCSLFGLALMGASGGAKESAAMPETVMQMAGADTAASAAAENHAAAEEFSLITDSAAEKTMESAMDDSPAEAEPGEAGTGAAPVCLETPRRQDTTACYTSEPRVSIIRSREELDDYFDHYAYQYSFEDARQACGEYDSGWFEAQDLLLIAVHSVPAGSACQVRSVAERDGIWEVSIAHDAFDPEICPETTDWHILLAAEKNQIPGKDAVVLNLERLEDAQ